MNNFSRIQLMDVLFNSLNFILFSGNIWFVILIEVFTNFYMKVLFDVTLVGLFYLVFMVLLLLFIYSPTEILYSNFEKWRGGRCGSPLCGPHRVPGFPCPI